MLLKASIPFIFILCLFSSSASAQILRFNLTCNFENSEILGNERYTCSLDGLVHDFSSPFYFIQVSGNHLGDRTNADVENLRLIRSRTNRIPSNIFNVFPNVVAVEVEDCGNINFIPPDFLYANNVRDLRIVSNNITGFGTSPFIHMGPTMETLILSNNNIQNLGPMPFANAFNVRHVSIANNQVRSLTPRMTTTLRSLRHFDASNNQIEDIDGRIFFSSPLVEIVNFSGNNIISIGSSVLNINSNIREFQLNGNRCIDENFNFENGNADLGSVRESLAECFRNSPLGTQLIMNLAGSLVIFDENDQVLLRLE